MSNIVLPPSSAGSATSQGAGGGRLLVQIPAGLDLLAPGKTIQGTVVSGAASGVSNVVLQPGAQTIQLPFQGNVALPNGASLLLEVLENTLSKAGQSGALLAGKSGGDASSGNQQVSASPRFSARVVEVNGKPPQVTTPANPPSSDTNVKAASVRGNVVAQPSGDAPKFSVSQAIIRAILPHNLPAQSAQQQAAVSVTSSGAGKAEGVASTLNVSNGLTVTATITKPLPPGLAGAIDLTRILPSPAAPQQASVIAGALQEPSLASQAGADKALAGLPKPGDNLLIHIRGVQASLEQASNVQGKILDQLYPKNDAATQVRAADQGVKLTAAISSQQSINGKVIGVDASGAALVQSPVGTFSIKADSGLTKGALVTFEVLRMGPPAGQQVNAASASLPQTVEQVQQQLQQGTSAFHAVSALLQEMDRQQGTRLHQGVFPDAGAAKQAAAKALWFFGALNGGGAAHWLGDEASSIIKKEQPELFSRLERSLGALRDAYQQPGAQGWHSAAAPFYDGEKLMVGWFHSRKQKNHTNKQASEDVRFAVDLDLDQLGAFQLDGLIRGARGGEPMTKQLEIVVRTERRLSSEIERDIAGIFHDYQIISGLKGSIIFQVEPRGVIPIHKLERHFDSDIII